MNRLASIVILSFMGLSSAFAGEELKFSLHFGIENQAAFCNGAPDDFVATCSPLELGKNLAAAKSKFSRICRSGFKGILQHVNCRCEALGQDSNGHELAKHPGRAVPRFNKNAVPNIPGAHLGFYSGPSNGAAMFVFKDGKPDAWSGGENITCENIDQFLPK